MGLVGSILVSMLVTLRSICTIMSGLTAKLKKHASAIHPAEGLQTMKLNKVDEAVIAALKPIGKKELTLAELAEVTGQPEKKVFKSLKKLFEKEMIDSCARKYKLLTDKPPVKAGNSWSSPRADGSCPVLSATKCSSVPAALGSRSTGL